MGILPVQSDHYEIEVKFCVKDLEQIEVRLQRLKAKQVQARIHEYNLRFDTPAGELARQSIILRLRRDTAFHLTLKTGNTLLDGVSQRREIEFKVSDFEAARVLLEALGYQVSMVYEKYRAIYRLESVLITLDEMPFGGFVEIEGPDGGGIQETSNKLGLNWDARVLASYADLFQVIQVALGLETRDLTFDYFKGIDVSANHLGIHYADV